MSEPDDPLADARYVELQVTTHFSFLRGASSPEELAAAAARLGLPAIGITDRNSFGGLVRAWDAQKGHRHPHHARRPARSGLRHLPAGLSDRQGGLCLGSPAC
jgi:hypothetical protein